MPPATLDLNPDPSNSDLQQKLTHAFNRSPNPLFVTDARGTVEFANQAFCRSRECSSQEVCDLNCQDFWSRHLTRDELSAMWRDLGAGRLWKTETCFTQPDGRACWEEVRLTALIDEAGQLTGLVGSLTDITQQKQSELALRDNEEKLRRILQTAHDAILLLDAEGKIRLWNEAASRIYGYSLEEAMGRQIDELLIPTHDIEAQRAAFREFRFSGQAAGIDQTTEFPVLRKDGCEIVVEMSLSAVKFEGQWFLLAVNRDVTERKKSEMERDLLFKSLEEALANIKTLRGLVPICAACKKIRDDNGFWNQVESYVSAHSEAKFSHGICPECAHKLYPQIASAIEAKHGAQNRSERAGAK
jgi:PAS domain S-box-containing protein